MRKAKVTPKTAMSLDDLQALGAFVADAPESVEIEWKGKTFDVLVKRLSYGAVESLRNLDGEFNTHLLARCIVLGDAPLTYADAFRLDPALAAALLGAINRVHMDDADPKGATSGTN